MLFADYSAPVGGEAPVIVGMPDVTMHTYAVVIDARPDLHDPESVDGAASRVACQPFGVLALGADVDCKHAWTQLG